MTAGSRIQQDFVTSPPSRTILDKNVQINCFNLYVRDRSMCHMVQKFVLFQDIIGFCVTFCTV